MCTEVYIGINDENAELEIIDDPTGFWVQEVKETQHYSKEILGTKRILKIGSFMGCTCGFAYGDWGKNMPGEDTPKRKSNVQALQTYLQQNRECLVGIVTFYKFDKMRREEFPVKLLNVPAMIDREFDFEDDVIYQLVY